MKALTQVEERDWRHNIHRGETKQEPASVMKCLPVLGARSVDSSHAVSRTNPFCVWCSAPAVLYFFFQVSGLSSTFAPILLEIIQSNQPEGVHLLVKEVGFIYRHLHLDKAGVTRAISLLCKAQDLFLRPPALL